MNDGHASEWAAVSSGVPQGSILGPLLFLIYVDDIGSDLTSQTRLFADDCTVYREVNGKTDMQALQTDLNHLYQWSQTWQLSLNLSKCKAICISNKRSPPLSPYYYNVPLDWVDTFKYLGITINRKLKWGDQVTATTSKATKILNLLHRNMHSCSKTAKKRAFVNHLE